MSDKNRVRSEACAERAQKFRDMRVFRQLTQSQLARLARTKQPAISRLEDPNEDAVTVKFMVRVACALECRLRFQFEPIEDAKSGDTP